ncbi:MAG: cytochrome c biogenesis protein CcsA [Myxococcales bacterium]|nr:cytochrome c biogenesis protein CcsA [Myxococcales bacterium]
MSEFFDGWLTSLADSPLSSLGTITLFVAFVIAAYAAAAGIVGNVQKRERLVTSSVKALHALCAIMVMASALLVYAFVTHDYSIKYVTMYSDTSMPLVYKLSAYWGGLDGSLMFWVFVLSVFSSIAIWTNHRRHKDMIGYVVGTIAVVQLFFLALLVFSKNPFATWLTEAPLDGKGLNPLLQTYWMVIHPPALYIGFVAATIPFAFGMGALASGRLDNQWMKSVRVWTFLCWFFLSFGLLLGGRWAYEELGWGGYWAWDPVENAGLLPWFTATAFLHSVIIQEQRGMLRVWNMALVIVTFFLTIFGTFMTRSGIVQSVHAFGEDNELALLFVLFMAFTVIVSVGMLIWRLPFLRAKNQFESLISREFAFLLNNWVLLGSAFFVLFATLFPTLSEAVNGERITVGPPFFNKWMIPIGLVLLFLAGATPLLAWRRTTRQRLAAQFAKPVALMVLAVAILAIGVPRTRVMTPILARGFKMPMALINFGVIAFVFGSIMQEFWGGMRVRMRQTGSDPITALIGITMAKRRKYGGYIIHLGIAVMFMGFAGKCFEVERNFTLSPGKTHIVRDYTITYDRLELDDTNSDHVMRWITHLDVTKDGEHLAHMAPEVRNYTKEEQPTHEVAIESSITPGSDFFQDLYLVFHSHNPQTQVASFSVYVNPLINWVWLGFGFLAIGTAFCLVREDWATAASRRRKSRAGRGTQAALIVLIVGASILGLTSLANAQPIEHDTAATHQASGSAAALNRENDPSLIAPYRAKVVEEIRAEQPNLDPTSTKFQAELQRKLEPIIESNRQLLKDLICLCGCPRESLYHCKCGIAARERGFILSILAKYDLSTAKGQADAQEDVVAEMIARKTNGRDVNGKKVLMVVPDEGYNKLAWAVPYLGLIGALFLLFAVSRRWVRTGQDDLVASGDSIPTVEDEDYSDILDDELRETD